MGRFDEHVVPTRDDAVDRRSRTPQRYRAYTPSLLAEIRIEPTIGTMERVSEAAEACASLDRVIKASPERVDHAIAMLSRSEGIGSATIEDYDASAQEIAIAEAGRAGSVEASTIIRGIEATRAGVENLGDPNQSISLQAIEHLQIDLMAGHSTRKQGYRAEQNRLGGSSLADAAYVPPPAWELDRLLDDLVNFIDDSGTRHPLIRAAIAHAQFILIHPFLDGNGRTGRVLVHAMLRREGLLRSAIIPLSLAILDDEASYIAGIRSLIFEGDQPDQSKINTWLFAFCDFAIEACRIAESLAERTRAIHQNMRATTQAHFRSDSIATAIVDLLVTGIGITSSRLVADLGVSSVTAISTLSKLEDLGVVQADRRSTPYVFMSTEILRLIEEATALGRYFDGRNKHDDNQQPGSCGAKMPRARVVCKRPAGHNGPHRAH